MNLISSRKIVPGAPPAKPRRTGSDLSVSLKFVLSNWGAVIALWAPAYLALLDRYGRGVVTRTEALEWALVIVGVLGLGSVLYVAWQDTRDTAWRTAHGMPQLPRPNAPGH
jgi:hypothetical protein